MAIHSVALHVEDLDSLHPTGNAGSRDHNGQRLWQIASTGDWQVYLYLTADGVQRAIQSLTEVARQIEEREAPSPSAWQEVA